jgi:hypothetical protein
MRLLVVLIAVMLTAAATAAGANPVRATMKTSATKPLVDTPWRYTITVKDPTGKPLAAKARLNVLLGTLVVGCWKRTAIVPCSSTAAGTWISFKGTRSGVIRWPARSAGVKLTFQATVVAMSRSLKLRAPVTVQLP